MELDIRVKMNEKLFLRNPEESVLGTKIVQQGLILINKLGFEEFTFKKLAKELQSTEASIYRYFENKHRFLVYLITWYWSYLEYKVIFSTNNILNPELKLKTIVKILAEEPQNSELKSGYISENEVYKLAIWEGSKSYLTKNVSKDNKDRLFKPYKDLCERIAFVVREIHPNYPFSHSLASTLLEMAHAQRFFMQNLPSLTDFQNEKNEKGIIMFLESLVFSTIKNYDNY